MGRSGCWEIFYNMNLLKGGLCLIVILMRLDATKAFPATSSGDMGENSGVDKDDDNANEGGETGSGNDGGNTDSPVAEAVKGEGELQLNADAVKKAHHHIHHLKKILDAGEDGSEPKQVKKKNKFGTGDDGKLQKLISEAVKEENEEGKEGSGADGDNSGDEDPDTPEADAVMDGQRNGLSQLLEEMNNKDAGEDGSEPKQVKKKNKFGTGEDGKLQKLISNAVKEENE